MNTRECLDMLLRPGNAGSSTFTDRKEVPGRALKQVPAVFRRKVTVRIDGAGASHDLVKYLLTLSSPRKTLLFTCGWMITESDEAAIMAVPGQAWKPGVRQDGTAEDDKDVAEITDLLSRAENWPDGLRWIARRVRPSRRHKKNLGDRGLVPFHRPVNRDLGRVADPVQQERHPAQCVGDAEQPRGSTSWPGARPSACAPGPQQRTVPSR